MSAERVSVLITDVEGSTAYTATHGDTAALDLIRTHERLLGDVVARHGGHQVKSLGDGLMIEFGSPDRAIRCALDIQAALEVYSTDHPSAPIRVRMGINTGPVIREKGDLYGTTVNAASRIVAKAGAGQILVASSTKEEAGPGTRCVFIDRGLFWLKGLRERWRLYEVAKEGTPSVTTVLREGTTPFVDRDVERSRLRQRVDEALSGRGSLAVLTGDAGVGKTRLAEEVSEEARIRGMTPFVARCYETTQDQAYTPLIETFEALEQHLDLDTFRMVLGEAGPEIARLLPHIRRSIPGIPPPAELPPDQEQRYLFLSARDSLAAAAGIRPLYLVWDDIHWADESSLRFLEHLAPELERLPILVVATCGQTDSDQAGPLGATLARLTRRRLAVPEVVPALEIEHVNQILEAIGDISPPTHIVEWLYRETEGNTFFLEEVVRSLLESGELFDSTGAWREDLAERFDLPESLRLFVHRRIDALSDRTRDILKSTAILGRAFGFEIAEALCDLSEDELLDGLDEAERRGLLRSKADAGVVTFYFTHELTRRTLVEDLSPARMQRLHLRAAEAIEGAYGPDLEERAAAIAMHLRNAGALSPSDRTAHYCVMAGVRAIGASAYEDALPFLAHALALQPQEPAARGPILELMGLAQRGQPAQAMACWREALESYEAAGDLEAVGRVCLDAGIQVAWWVRGHGAVELAERGLAALGNQPSPLRPGLLALSGSLQSEQGNYAAGKDLLEKALHAAEEDADQRVLGMVLYSRTTHHFAYNEFREAVEFGNRSVTYLRDAGDLWNLANVLGYVGASCCWLGDYSRAKEIGQEAVDLAQRIGNWSAFIFGDRARTFLGFCSAPDLDWYEQDGRNAYGLGEEQGFQWLQALGHTRMGLADFWRGEWDNALGHFEEAARLESPGASGGHLGPLVLTNAYIGNSARAAELLEAARPDFPAVGSPLSFTARTLALVALEAYAILGRDDEAAALYPIVRDALSSGVVARGWDIRLMPTLGGISAACAGDWSRASEHFEEALRLVDELPHRLEEGDACRFHAWALLKRGRARDRQLAGELLRRAIDSHRRIGMLAHEALDRDLLRQV